MKTRFICNVSNARLLRNRINKCEGFEAEYVVERVVYLSKRDLNPQKEHSLQYFLLTFLFNAVFFAFFNLKILNCYIF